MEPECKRRHTCGLIYAGDLLALSPVSVIEADFFENVKRDNFLSQHHGKWPVVLTKQMAVRSKE